LERVANKALIKPSREDLRVIHTYQFIGMPMQTPEHQIALVKNIPFSKDLAGKYDLYITDKRFVIINTSSFTYVGAGVLGSFIGEGIRKIGESKKKEKMKDLTLDEMLEKDKKKSFAIAYEDIEQIKLHDPKSRWKNRSLEIKSRNAQTRFLPKKEQFEQLSGILPSIVLIKGKLEN
jgi:hypothetical protein